MSGKKTNNDYPDHLNPFSSRRNNVISSSFKGIKNSILNKFGRKKHDNSPSSPPTIRKHSSAIGQTSTLYRQTIPATYRQHEALPRSRMSERLAKTDELHRMQAKNPFEEEDESTQTANVKISKENIKENAPGTPVGSSTPTKPSTPVQTSKPKPISPLEASSTSINSSVVLETTVSSKHPPEVWENGDVKQREEGYGTLERRMRRRKKKRAPMPPSGHRMGDDPRYLNVPSDQYNSKWSLTSVETDYSSYSNYSEYGDEVPPSNISLEHSESFQNIAREISKLADDTNNNSIIKDSDIETKEAKPTLAIDGCDNKEQDDIPAAISVSDIPPASSQSLENEQNNTSAINNTPPKVDTSPTEIALAEEESTKVVIKEEVIPKEEPPIVETCCVVILTESAEIHHETSTEKAENSEIILNSEEVKNVEENAIKAEEVESKLEDETQTKDASTSLEVEVASENNKELTENIKTVDHEDKSIATIEETILDEDCEVNQEVLVNNNIEDPENSVSSEEKEVKKEKTVAYIELTNQDDAHNTVVKSEITEESCSEIIEESTIEIQTNGINAYSDSEEVINEKNKLKNANSYDEALNDHKILYIDDDAQSEVIPEIREKDSAELMKRPMSIKEKIEMFEQSKLQEAGGPVPKLRTKKLTKDTLLGSKEDL